MYGLAIQTTSCRDPHDFIGMKLTVNVCDTLHAFVDTFVLYKDVN